MVAALAATTAMVNPLNPPTIYAENKDASAARNAVVIISLYNLII